MSSIAVCNTRASKRRDFKIIDETDHYIVIDKPPLLLVHPTKPDGATTLWAELRQLLALKLPAADRFPSSIGWIAKRAASCSLRKRQQQRANSGY